MRRRLLAVAASLFATSLFAGDWTTGTGGRPDRNGMSSEHGPTAPAILWDTCPHDSVFGNQAVTEGNLVASSRVLFTDIVNDTWIVAQDLDTGAELWSVQLPISFPDSWWSRVVAIRDGQVYATRAGNTNLEYLYALDPTDGSVLWPSEALTDAYGNETPSFTSNGDLIVGNFTSILRIDHTDGHTQWQTPRQCPGSGGCEATVSGNRVYGLEVVNSPGGLQYLVTVYDATTGAPQYSTVPLRVQPFGINEVSLFAGPDGTIYLPLTNNTPGDALIALEDTGSALTEKWRVPIAYVPFASFGVGPDGSVYSYSTDSELLRIDPVDGNVLNTSLPVPRGATFTPRMSVDARGRVFLTNTYDTLLSYDADLRLRWSDGVPDVSYGGPSIGQDGTVVVCGSGSIVRAYRTPFSADAPLRVDAHTSPETSSDGNGVLEPGETVLVEPSWENGTNAGAALTGLASNLGGPAGAAYVIDAASTDYSAVAAGATANCADATGVCARVTVTPAGPRPVEHWDATFDETLSAGTLKTWTLHVGGSFSDVSSADSFYPFIETILHAGVTAGCDTGIYCPTRPVIRSEMAVFLLRARHGPSFVPPACTGTLFADVACPGLYADWIEELSREQVTAGCGGGDYCPDRPVTRAEMAVFVLKMEHGWRFVPPACGGVFDDVLCPDAFAVDWIERLAAEGVTVGCAAGLYCPDNPNTRGEMAVFLTKGFGLRLYGP